MPDGVDEAAFLAALREREERWAQVYEELFFKVTSIRDEDGRLFVSLDGAAGVIAGPRPQPDQFPEDAPWWCDEGHRLPQYDLACVRLPCGCPDPEDTDA